MTMKSVFKAVVITIGTMALVNRVDALRNFVQG